MNGVLVTEIKNEENEVISHENDKLMIEKNIEDYKKNKIGTKEKEIEDTNL